MVDALDSKSNAFSVWVQVPPQALHFIFTHVMSLDLLIPPGNIMVVCGPAKSEVWVQFPSWLRPRNGIGRHVVLRMRFLWVRVPSRPIVNPSSSRLGQCTFYAETRVQIP
jgi:hypothetical protein